MGADKVPGLVNVSSRWEGADNKQVNKRLLVVKSNVTVSDFRACWGRVRGKAALGRLCLLLRPMKYEQTIW